MLYVCIITYLIGLSLLLYIWFDSLLIDKLSKPFHTKRLKSYLENNPGDNLPMALAMEYKNLLFQMLSCPFCLSFWMNVVSIGVVVFIKKAPIYLYCFLPITWYFTYVFYLIILKLEK